jgi:hypothetical protein
MLRAGIVFDFFPHPVEQRKVENCGIHQNYLVPASFKLRDDPLRNAIAHAIDAHRTLQNRYNHVDDLLR